MMNRLLFFLEDMKQFFEFIKWIPGFYKLYLDYGYKPYVYSSIIENYEEVLVNRTKHLSKPTHHWKVVVDEIDQWYEERLEDDIK